jgi:hypothetical protein
MTFRFAPTFLHHHRNKATQSPLSLTWRATTPCQRGLNMRNDLYAHVFLHSFPLSCPDVWDPPVRSSSTSPAIVCLRERVGRAEGSNSDLAYCESLVSLSPPASPPSLELTLTGPSLAHSSLQSSPARPGDGAPTRKRRHRHNTSSG